MANPVSDLNAAAANEIIGLQQELARLQGQQTELNRKYEAYKITGATELQLQAIARQLKPIAHHMQGLQARINQLTQHAYSDTEALVDLSRPAQLKQGFIRVVRDDDIPQALHQQVHMKEQAAAQVGNPTRVQQVVQVISRNGHGAASDQSMEDVIRLLLGKIRSGTVNGLGAAKSLGSAEAAAYAHAMKVLRAKLRLLKPSYIAGLKRYTDALRLLKNRQKRLRIAQRMALIYKAQGAKKAAIETGMNILSLQTQIPALHAEIVLSAANENPKVADAISAFADVAIAEANLEDYAQEAQPATQGEVLETTDTGEFVEEGKVAAVLEQAAPTVEDTGAAVDIVEEVPPITDQKKDWMGQVQDFYKNNRTAVHIGAVVGILLYLRGR
jgi:predicted transcriptional regulator